MSGRTGCGICGAESLEQIRLPVPTVKSDSVVSHDALQKATMSLADYQPLQAVTGAVHGAAWFDPKGKMVQVCEDIGRHNALDKVIGHCFKNSLFDTKNQFIACSGRLSFELVQKTLMANIGLLMGVGAPTSLAIDLAKRFDMTLIGFVLSLIHI